MQQRLWMIGALAMAPFFMMGQQFGGNPTSTRWFKISNEAARVIFPAGQDSAAQRIAWIAEQLQSKHAGTIGQRKKRIDVVLQPDVNFSNAYVQLAPWRSEYFMMPPQNPFELGAVNWVDNLAIHEFRHVQQFNHFNTGLSKVMGFLFGQGGRGLANVAAVPDWFFEGDAVWNETAFTSQGRGRLPLFQSAYKSLQHDNRRYSYMKLRNGSLRHYVPGHYELGYLLVNYGRATYGDTIWQKVTEDAAAYRGLLYPMQGAIRRHTQVSFSSFIESALVDFRKRWQQPVEEPEWITQASRQRVIDYKYPYPAEQGEMVVLKTSYNQIPTFIRIDTTGIENRIAIKFIGYDDYFSYRNGRIVYTALKPDKRWGNRDFSDVVMLDVNTGNTSRITSQSRLFSPDVSLDGQHIVAVAAVPGKAALLQLLSARGEVLKSFTADSSLFYSHPKFLAGDQEVVAAVRNKTGEMGWLIWDTRTNGQRWLLPLSNRLVGFPVVCGDTLYYTATEGTVDALHAQQISTGERYRLNAYGLGTYQGFVRQGALVGSFFTSSGYRLAKSTPAFSRILPSNQGFVTLYPGENAPAYVNFEIEPSYVAPVEKYRKTLGFFNFHTLVPELNEPDYTFRMLGNNVLNTTQTDLFYRYNTNETSHTAGLNFLYGGWYIQPLIGVQQVWNRKVFFTADTTFLYNETEFYGGFSLPLNFTGRKHFRFLTLTSTINTDRVAWKGMAKDLLRDANFTYLQNRLLFTSQIQRARQHIFPRWAQSILVDYRTMVDDNQARQLLASGSFYFPGVGRNHSFVFNAAWQGRDTLRQYVFSNSFPFSRGYTSVNFPRMWRLGANYHFPLFYPDWGFGQMVYFLRLRANWFYDYTKVKSLRTGQTRAFSSTGLEIYFDTRWWNQLPLSIGVRYSRLLDDDFNPGQSANQWELVLPVNIF